MNPNWLEFEQPIAELESRIHDLRMTGDDSGVNLAEEIHKLEDKSKALTKKIFSHLSAWQHTQLARHIQRPHSSDYIKHIFTEFDELHGDRGYADDPAIISGIARLDDISVVVIGQEKGRDVEDKVRCNFGMPKPEGYRKAKRIMEMAGRFKLPIITFVDTPGAYPGINAEERGQSLAIAENLAVMSRLPVPIISTVIGEGGSGGALAISVADKLNMLQYSTYSVISPEGCASILWKDAAHAEEAAEAMGITAQRLLELCLIDQIIDEPLGGAHRDAQVMAQSLRNTLKEQLSQLQTQTSDELVANRYEKLKAITTAV